MRTRRTILVPALVTLALSCSDDGAPGDFAVELAGAVEKGPFVLGSSIAISTVDRLGNPTGEVFNTTTINDAGEFSVEFRHRGFVSLEGDGFYFNEVTGELSGAPLTLRAFHEIVGGGPQSAYINLVTHLSYERVRRLIGEGLRRDEAVVQAEGELREAIGVGTSDFEPGAAGIEMNVLGGDIDANAYLFAASAVLAQAAVLRGGPVDATLQELVNTVSIDLADDGEIARGTADSLLEAQQAVDPEAVMAALADRLADIGSDAPVPDLDRILDTDLDDVANADDNCRVVPNGDQADEDEDGVGDACDCGSGTLDPGEECDDGNEVDADGCEADCTLPRCGNGIEDPGEVCFVERALVELADPRAFATGDFDGDGVLDLAVANGSEANVGVMLGTGGGDFGPVSFVGMGGSDAVAIAVADLDDDLAEDIVVMGRETIVVVLGDGLGGFGEPATCRPGEVLAAHLHASFGLADFDGDGATDLFVPGFQAFVSVLRGAGDGTFTPVNSWEGGEEVSFVLAADFDRDSNSDVATADDGNPILRPFMGDGTASFTGAGTFPTGLTGTGPLIAADLDGDAVDDLLTVGWQQVAVLIGDGGGGFQAPATFDAHEEGHGAEPPSIALGALDGDDSLDVILAHDEHDVVLEESQLHFLRGNGAGGFGEPETIEIGGAASAVFVADLDDDGLDDLVTGAAGAVRVFFHGGP